MVMFFDVGKILSRRTPAHKQGALQDPPEAAVLTTVPYVHLLYSNLQVKGIN